MTATPPIANRQDDDVLALALNAYVDDRRAAHEQVTVQTAEKIVKIARLRRLAPTSDVRLLGFELAGTVLQPLDAETVQTLQARVADAPQGHFQLDWLCEVILGRPVGELEALLT